jgi:hypothetical protein
MLLRESAFHLRVSDGLTVCIPGGLYGIVECSSTRRQGLPKTHRVCDHGGFQWTSGVVLYLPERSQLMFSGWDRKIRTA